MSAAFHFAYLIFSSIGARSTAPLSLSKMRRSSRKLAAARNFFAVFLRRRSGEGSTRARRVRCGTAGAPCRVAFPILRVRIGKDAERKVLDVGGARGLVVHGVVGAEVRLYALKKAEEVEEEVAGGRVLELEADA